MPTDLFKDTQADLAELEEALAEEYPDTAAILGEAQASLETEYDAMEGEGEDMEPEAEGDFPPELEGEAEEAGEEEDFAGGPLGELPADLEDEEEEPAL